MCPIDSLSFFWKVQTTAQKRNVSLEEAFGAAMVEDVMKVAEHCADRALFLGVLDLSTEGKVPVPSSTLIMQQLVWWCLHMCVSPSAGPPALGTSPVKETKCKRGT